MWDIIKLYTIEFFTKNILTASLLGLGVRVPDVTVTHFLLKCVVLGGDS